MEALDTKVRMRWAKLLPHPRFEGFGRVRITKDRFAFPEKPPDLDEGASIGGRARERREVGNYGCRFFPSWRRPFYKLNATPPAP
jgi:hypothetical protein